MGEGAQGAAMAWGHQAWLGAPGDCTDPQPQEGGTLQARTRGSSALLWLHRSFMRQRRLQADTML